MSKVILEFIFYTFSSVKNLQRFFILSGVMFFVIGLYLAPLVLQLMNMNLSILFIMAMILLITPFTISSLSYLEIVLRESVYRVFHMKVNSMNKPSIEIEAVHYTGAIEKYVWSITDCIKTTLAVLVSIIALMFSGWLGFVISITVCIFIYILSSHATTTVYRVRKLIIISNKKLLMHIKTKSSSGKTIQSSADRYIRHRAYMILWRAKIHMLSATVSALFILVGIYLLHRSDTTGIIVASTGFIVGGVVTKMIDSYAVMLSESYHIKEFKIK